jgi:hypothetical protein
MLGASKAAQQRRTPQRPESLRGFDAQIRACVLECAGAPALWISRPAAVFAPGNGHIIENDEIRMTNAELIANSESCGALPPERRDMINIRCAKVERVILNALQKTAALPPDTCAFGDQTSIVFGAVTDAKQRPGFPPDPPPSRRRYPLTRADVITLVVYCFGLRHLVIPSSLDICHSSFPAT